MRRARILATRVAYSSVEAVVYNIVEMTERGDVRYNRYAYQLTVKIYSCALANERYIDQRQNN
jgi:hypothetical protein